MSRTFEPGDIVSFPETPSIMGVVTDRGFAHGPIVQLFAVNRSGSTATWYKHASPSGYLTDVIRLEADGPDELVAYAMQVALTGVA